MSDVSQFWNGTPPQTNMTGYTNWIKAPSYDFSSKLYSYLEGMIGAPAPRWNGFGGLKGMAGQKNPFMNSVTDLAGRYFNLGMPSSFQSAMGTFGRYANPSFSNPTAQIGAPATSYMQNSFAPSQQFSWMPQPPQQG